LDELSDRTGRALSARSRADLRRALSDLPVLPSAPELLAQGRSAVRAAAHGAAVVLFTGLYLVFSFTLVVVLGVTLLVQGASAALLAVFLLVWLLPTYALSRVWRGGRPRT
jgi:hypothetical protein